MSQFTATIWHGADYNPEQWLETPLVLEADLTLMNAARLNSATLGIFSWSALEPREGKFCFGWLDQVFENLASNGQKIVMATPSGAKPHWMAKQYPEVRRVNASGAREPQQGRHNHCPTSPVYRAKCAAIDGELTRRYGAHPALLAWHISNELSGQCFCELCFAAFRDWLKVRYHNDLDALNRAYWSRFWSKNYGDWDEIDFVDEPVHALKLDWQRFITHQTTDFMRSEIAVVRAHSAAPVTTNMMGDFAGLDYAAMAPHLDFISWDAYPQWGSGQDVGETGDETEAAIWAAFHHDFFRSLKQKPFWLMECSPGQTNWREVSKLKSPGVHRLSALQTLAHGGDAVMYFQWRQSRGSSEKWHGAVVSHEGSAHTRTFGEVAALGRELESLSDLAGARTSASVALIYDFENLWALWGEQGQRNIGKDPEATARDFYAPFWKRGLAVDIVASTADFSDYKLIVAPMLAMIRPGVAERLTAWVRAGGTLVTTYKSGLVDQSDLCFLGGFPGPLREVLGLWVEETDALHAHQSNRVRVEAPELELRGEWHARDYCDLIHPESTRVLATYREDFYAGRAALTVNDFGAGRAFYVASRNESDFQDALLGSLAAQLELAPALRGEFSPGVNVQRRVKADIEFAFVLNFRGARASFSVDETDWETLRGDQWERLVADEFQSLAGYGAAVMRKIKVK